MARIRTIKPEFPQSESMGRVSRDARLLFILLWTLCDDEGRSRGDARLLKGLLYPYDEVRFSEIDAWLDELEREGCVIRYEADGSRYVAIRNWLNHQKIDRPTPSKLPRPREKAPTPRDPSRVLDEDSSVDLDLDLEGNGKDLDLDRVPHARAHEPEPEKPIDDHAEFETVQAAYPLFAGRLDWLTAEHHARRIVALGRADWPRLRDAVTRYAAFVAAGGVSGPRYVLTPAKFFGDADEPWAQPWTPPPTKAESRLAENLTAAEEFMRRTDSAA